MNFVLFLLPLDYRFVCSEHETGYSTRCVRTGADQMSDVEVASFVQLLVRWLGTPPVETAFHTHCDFRKTGVAKRPDEEVS